MFSRSELKQRCYIIIAAPDSSRDGSYAAWLLARLQKADPGSGSLENAVIREASPALEAIYLDEDSFDE